MLKFIKKSWSNSSNNRIVYKSFLFPMLLHNYFQTKHSAFVHCFTGATESEKSVGGCSIGSIPAINLPKCHGGKVHVFRQETFEVVRVLLFGNWSIPSIYGFCWTYEHPRSRKGQWKLYLSLSVPKSAKIWNLLCKWKFWSCLFLVRI